MTFADIQYFKIQNKIHSTPRRGNRKTMNTHNAWQVTIPFLQADVVDTPNTRSNSSEGKLDDYYQAMFVTFASLARFNPDIQLNLASNHSLPVRYQDMYSAIRVHTQIVPFTRQVLAQEPRAFAASLYYLDVIRDLRGEQNIMLDPDVLCVDKLQFIEELSSRQLGGIQLNYDPARSVNGLSRAQASHLHTDLGLPPQLPDYYGGEIYVLPSAHLQKVSDYAETAWQYTLEQSEGQNPRFYTEEHIMNFVLAHFPVVNLKQSIQRVWTTHRHRTVSGNESNLSLWHLPAEKGRGFRKTFTYALNKDSWFWQAERQDFVRNCASIMGIDHRPLSRWIPDQLGVAANVLLGAKR
ncbi:hypothetical protein [Kocuria rosea]|uniref:hypothetical protein n=1 Tax=Kocuria rosea TaxID=1275 RepID=UPI003D349626